MPIVDIPCEDCELQQDLIKLQGWTFIDCTEVMGGFCRLRYDDEPTATAKLTPHFTLREMTESQTAARLGILNLPTETELTNLKYLAEAMEKIRASVKQPIRISSAFRSSKLNLAVGGTSNSAHLRGLAADINVNGMTPRQLALHISEMKLPFDQLILEYDSWVHVGLHESKNRQELLTIRKGTGYLLGIC
ncbi:Peptidase M15 [Duganella sp. CF458]|uniref:D-Ala-D-Ala carboxypeptidase family metallohydrolase n=1 Tax=Duganella sp. CF458 TaxID=1884368 RepID=UPI0008E68BBC|nr:D-Ala-D-Ala carboxypeptidase family metallohydrolase [Duganella sp. CF458]SFH04189.1 Peptidase M15 [Duganella sp. CF458]